MRWILHRGNYAGPMSIENRPDDILILLKQGYEIEVDLWVTTDRFFLGHDYPAYEVDESFIENPGLWIHCKDAKTLEYMNTYKKDLHYFYHTNEDYVLTSKRFIWCYVGKPELKGSVVVMPEKNPSNYDYNILVQKNCIVCSDYLEYEIKDMLTQKV